MKAIFCAIILTAVSSLCFAQGEPPLDNDPHNHNHGAHSEIVDSLAVVVDTVQIVVDGDPIVTVSSTKEMVEGSIAPYNFDKKYFVEAIDRATGRHTKIRVEYDGRFFGRLSLEQGVNYIDFILREKTKQGIINVDSTCKILFVRKPASALKQSIIYIDAFAAAKTLTTDTMAIDLVRRIKDAGFTAIAFEAKTAEGFVAYRQNDLSATPYLSATRNVRHAKLREEHPFVEIDTLTGDTLSVRYFDLLGAVAGAADTLGVKFYAAFNFFTGGNITTRDTAIIYAHPEWESYVLSVEGDSTFIAPLSESLRGREAHDKGNRLQYAFTNPADPDVQQDELARVSEVITNYPIDGVIINRCRYDGLDADFSDVTRNKFEIFLTTRGKILEDFVHDVRGPLFADWIEFRASVIADFTAQLRKLTSAHTTDSTKIELAAYVGDWYDKYYSYGINWASSNFRYHPYLQFENPEIYTDSYATTNFLHSLDFLIVGVYNETLKRDIALAEIITNAELPLAIALRMPEQMNEVTLLHAAEASTAGVMLLELSRIEELSAVAPMIEGAMPAPVAEKVVDKAARKAIEQVEKAEQAAQKAIEKAEKAEQAAQKQKTDETPSK